MLPRVGGIIPMISLNIKQEHCIPFGIFIPGGIAILAQSAWGVLYLLKHYTQITSSSQYALTMIAFLGLQFGVFFPFFFIRRYVRNVDPIMYVMGGACWASMANLCMVLELEKILSTDWTGYWLKEGEPALDSAHGRIVLWIDGVAHFIICIVAISLYVQQLSHREVQLYWTGSVMNSLIVLVNAEFLAGVHPFKFSLWIKFPYAVCIVVGVGVLMYRSPPQAWIILKFSSIVRRPLDLAFSVYFIAAFVCAHVRGLALMGAQGPYMPATVALDPYMTDPNNFARVQVMLYHFLYSGYYVVALHSLLNPGCHWMSDWAIMHAGAALQAEITTIFSMWGHKVTKAAHHAPMKGVPAVWCWSIHVCLLVIPQLFAIYCIVNPRKFGRTYNIDRACIIDKYMWIPKFILPYRPW